MPCDLHGVDVVVSALRDRTVIGKETYVSDIYTGIAQELLGDFNLQAATAQRDQKEREKKAKRTKTILWVVLGTVGAALLGTGTYLIARKR